MFQRLAENGNADAQLTLGMNYTLGHSVTQDYEEGRFWLKLASNQGSDGAQLNLGNLYAAGIGVERDIVRAYAWYLISADNGNLAGRRNRDALAHELDVGDLDRAHKLAVELGGSVPTSHTAPPH